MCYKKVARFGIAKRFLDDTRSPVMADLIKAADLKNRMKKIPEWELEKNHIERTFEFDDFADAIDFVNAVAEVAEDEEHHPDIDIRYNKVRLVLSTHSKGGLTELDFGLAERIDTLSAYGTRRVVAGGVDRSQHSASLIGIDTAEHRFALVSVRHIVFLFG